MKPIYYHSSLEIIRAFVLSESLNRRPVRLYGILFYKSHLSVDDFQKNKGTVSHCLSQAEKELGENFDGISEIFHKLSLLIKYKVIDEAFLQDVLFTEAYLVKV